MTSYRQIITAVAVMPADCVESFDERATQVSIQNEGGGSFVEVTQCYGSKGEQTIRIDAEEWPAISKAVNRIFAEIQKMEKLT